jgi:hypothetical protein
MRLLLDGLARSPVGAEPDRSAEIEKAWEELERRGHNVEGCARWGLGRIIATSIVIATVLPDLEEVRVGQEGVRSPETLREAPPGWTDLLSEVKSPDPSLDELFTELPDEQRAGLRKVLGALAGPFRELAYAWVKTASRDDLIAWRPPSDREEVLTLGAIEAVTKEERDTYRWLIDRFTSTYLSDWSKESLYLEWRYLHAELVAPCSSGEMAHRRIAEVDVSRAIATRVASVQGNRRPGDDVGDDNDKPRQASGLSIGRIMTAALEFLSAGRRTAAAALFEAAKRSNPNDAEVRNNYGFCILPDHPEEGLQEIHVGSELGFDRRDITLANRMYGLFRLHRFASALEAAERLFLEEENDHKAYLWDWRKDADNATILNVDARHYGVEFALDIAHLVGDISQINLWSNRADSLGLSFGD